MEVEQPDTREETPKKNSAKIYFFCFAIATLLATNIYYALKYKNLGKEVELLNTEKSQLEAEVDRIEAELDRVTKNNSPYNAMLSEEQAKVRAQIANLRERLSLTTIDKKDIDLVRFKIQNLRNLVEEYSNDIEKLKKKNKALSLQRDKLLNSVDSSIAKVDKLTEENASLQEKVEKASGLKISGMTINGIKKQSRNREKTETRARRTDNLKITFNVVDNPLAKKGLHSIYLRIIDPSGNLLTFNNDTFEANGRSLQYTFQTSLEFSNDGKLYSVEWHPHDDSGFQKGNYTIVLYTDGYTMGRGGITLK